jgi:hypothetical protein
MEPTDDLLDALYVDKVLAARRMPLGEKLFAGASLFAYACETARIGIRMQHPNASPEEVEQLLRKRLQLAEMLEARRQGGELRD